MEEDEDIIDEMDARLDAHRMLVALIISHLPDRTVEWMILFPHWDDPAGAPA